MATKSKNNWSLVWSLLALSIGVVTIGFCITYIYEMLNEGALRSSRAIAQLARFFKGGV
ncbi:hypothetical protein ACXYMX_11385 [Sporosarcina sp. CAU 1771]